MQRGKGFHQTGLSHFAPLQAVVCNEVRPTTLRATMSSIVRLPLLWGPLQHCVLTLPITSDVLNTLNQALLQPLHNLQVIIQSRPYSAVPSCCRLHNSCKV